MNTICSKQKFLAKIARERTRTDQTGNCFSVITFHMNTLSQHESDENAAGDLFIKNTRGYDDIGFLEKDCFGILCLQMSYEQAHKLAYRFCRTVIPANQNPTFTVFTYPSPEEFGKQALDCMDVKRRSSAAPAAREVK